MGKLLSVLLSVLLWSVERITARPLPFGAASIALAAAALAITLQHLRIDTSTTDMISPEVPFRQNLLAFQRAFPDFRDTIVAVIEGDSPERVDRAAVWLAFWLLGHPVGLAEAVILESLAQATRSVGFMLPGGLGAQEGGIVTGALMLGIGADLALAVALLKRARELAYGIAGLIAWSLVDPKPDRTPPVAASPQADCGKSPVALAQHQTTSPFVKL